MKMLNVILILALLCLFPACSGGSPPGEPESAYQTISAEEARNMMDADSPYILLDVRTKEEFEESRIEGAILIPDYEIAERAETDLPDQDAVILIYCRSGRRSTLAANELADIGYTNVYDFGGIIDWPYDTVSG